jgi:hypothetical protein
MLWCLVSWRHTYFPLLKLNFQDMLRQRVRCLFRFPFPLVGMRRDAVSLHSAEAWRRSFRFLHAMGSDSTPSTPYYGVCMQVRKRGHHQALTWCQTLHPWPQPCILPDRHGMCVLLPKGGNAAKGAYGVHINLSLVRSLESQEDGGVLQNVECQCQGKQ